MIETGTLLWAGVALLGIALSALFSGLETGSYCINRVRLAVRAEAAEPAPDFRARLLRNEIEKPERLLSTLLIGNNIANYLGSIGIAAVLTRAGYGDWAIVIINAALLTPLLFVFGETLPKDLFRARPDRLTVALAPLLVAIRWILTALLILPLVRLIGAAAARFVGAEAGEALGGARAKVAALLKEGARHGVLTESQTTLVDRALTLRETRVRDEMTPWRDAAIIGADWTRERIRRQLARRIASRYPVLNRRGDVLGVVDALDIWLESDRSIRDLTRPAVDLAPDISVRAALITLRTAGEKIAVVREKGRPIGVVTFKDLMDPITGELDAW